MKKTEDILVDLSLHTKKRNQCKDMRNIMSQFPPLFDAKNSETMW